MFVDKNSVVLDGIKMGQYLTQVDCEYPKLWSSDSGRNLAGDQSGTLIGIFPKIIMSFKPLRRQDIETLAPHFDSARQTVSYYDPYKKQQISVITYSGDWKVVSKKIIAGNARCEAFDLSFISVSRRR